MTGPAKPIDGFIDIEVPKPRISFRRVVIGLLGAAILLAPLVIVANMVSQDYQRLAVGILLFALGVPVLVVFTVIRLRISRNIRRAATDGDLVACAIYVGSVFRKGLGQGLALELVNELIHAHHKNVTIRMRPVDECDVIVPLAYPFSPMLLNESESTFLQMEEPINSPRNLNPSDSMLSHVRNEKRLTTGLRRNLHLNVGWIGLTFLCFMIVFFALASFQQRSFMWLLGLVTVILIGLLFVSPSSGQLSSRQLLIVPGGLVLRRPAKNLQRSRLHLFDRRASVLCVEKFGRTTSTIYVDDGQQRFAAPITSREARMLLRAWLSPLQPPPVEKLIDLQ